MIGELPLSVNIVAREEAIIKLAQTNNYWATATDDTFDELAEKLSHLMKYRDGGGFRLGLPSSILPICWQQKKWSSLGRNIRR